jgi:hypothetical protein
MVNNNQKRILFSIMFSILGGGSSLFADTVYTYTGNVFTDVSAPYTTSDYIRGSFSTATPLPANTLTDIVATTKFSFTDGVQTITNTTPNIEPSFTIKTDQAGNIITWVVALQDPNGFGIITANDAGEANSAADGGSTSFSNQGSNENSPGVWGGVSASPVPEPGSVALFSAAGIAVVAMRLRKRAARQ